MERIIERLLFASRWILAPVYLGMSLALIALGVKFFVEAWAVMSHLLTIEEADLVLHLLAMIDLVLVGSLIVMVMFSGYENFVSRLDVAGEGEKLEWLGKLDAGTLKLKVAASIVAISSIHLLRKFMEVENLFGEHGDGANNQLMWYVIIHMTFVASAVLMGVLDRLSFAGHRKH